MSRNYRDDELPLHRLSPTSKSRLPPGHTDPSMSDRKNLTIGRGPHGQGLQRRVSKNVMPNVPGGKSQEALKGVDAVFSTLPTEKLKRIDYVIVAKLLAEEDASDGKEGSKKHRRKVEWRERFRAALDADGVQVQEEDIGERRYLKLHVPFWRLCKEAERMKLEMPLDGCEIYDESQTCRCWKDWEAKHLVTDNELDFVTAPYLAKKHQVFANFDNPDIFYSPSRRSYIAHHILINMDIRDRSKKDTEEDPLARKGLPYLLHKGVYEDAFILHDETKDDPAERKEKEDLQAKYGSQIDIENPDEDDADTPLVLPDTRKELDQAWCKAKVFCKYQPLWKIRNYFGEKIALYFAWSGTMIASLWIPCLFGFACFLYGLYLSITNKEEPAMANNATIVDQATYYAEASLNIIKKSFDNDITPYYALVICLWGTIFLEVWKRKNAKLAYEWDVDNFEDFESDRPQFIGTHTKKDPIIPGEDTWYYPMTRYFLKFCMSFSVLIFMVILVFIAVASVILYRVIMTVDYCSGWSPLTCLIIGTICSSLLNAVAILLLGKIYDKLAIILTNWENHRTQTQHDDALIIKLFAFQFVNCYSSLFYIAFFREGVGENGMFGLGPQYQDTCGDDGCMAMLSFQVLVLMLAKPLPKFLKDIILPWAIRFLKRKCCCCKKKSNQVSVDGQSVQMHHYLEREKEKPDLGDFTLGEYTEKVIVYGFLMLFAASFPLAPLIAILINLIDIRVDGKRMIWMYRRPVSFIAQDIGMWYGILQFINVVGVISNACLIAFTSSWGAKYESMQSKLWIVLGFEHIVFAIKFFLATIIPDVPSKVKLQMKKEKYQVQKILEEAGKNPDKKLKDIRGESAKLNRSKMNGIDEDPDSLRQRKGKGDPDGQSASEPDESFYRSKRSSKKSKKSKEKSASQPHRKLMYDENGDTYFVEEDEKPRTLPRKSTLPPLGGSTTPRTPKYDTRNDPDYYDM